MGMHTVGRMRKRIFPLAAGALLGIGLSPFAVHFALFWGLFPNRDLSHASSYVQEVMEIVNDNYIDPPSAAYDRLARSAIHGMVETLDPHSEYLESKDNEQLEDDLSGEFGGIGIQVEVRDGHVYVISPMKGTPSDRAGVRSGDEILSIDGIPVENFTASFASGTELHQKLMNRKEGDQVTLEIVTPGARAPRTIILTQMQTPDWFSDHLR